MRPIDADELRKCAIPCEIHNGALTELCVPLYQIDNAPTVEPEKVLVANVTFDEDKLKEIVQTEIDKIKIICNDGLVIKSEERLQEDLKEALSKRLWFVSSPECDAQEIKDIIDDAPTIKTFTLVDIEEQYCKGLEKGLSEWKTERPQGEWKFKKFDEETGISNSYWCPFCGKPKAQVYDNFCPNCGADMRGEKENEST